MPESPQREVQGGWRKVFVGLLFLCIGGITVIAGHGIAPMGFIYVTMLMQALGGGAGLGSLFPILIFVLLCSAAAIGVYLLQRSGRRAVAVVCRNVIVAVTLGYLGVTALITEDTLVDIERDRFLVLFGLAYGVIVGCAVTLLASSRTVSCLGLAAVCVLAFLASGYSVYLSEYQVVTMLTSLPAIIIAGAAFTAWAVGKV